MAETFGVGLGRTGTKSLTEALKLLGYLDVVHNPGTFEELLTASAAVEGAVLNHWKFLVAYYPSAKFVLTTRSLNSWLDSSRRAMEKYPIERLRGTKYFPLAVRNRMYRWGSVEYDEKAMKSHFRHHEIEVRAAVPYSRLYVHRLGSGWTGLCKFLGRPVPSEPYPYIIES